MIKKIGNSRIAKMDFFRGFSSLCGVGDLRFGAPMQTLVEIVNQNNSSRNLKVVLISSVFCRLSFFDDRK